METRNWRISVFTAEPVVFFDADKVRRSDVERLQQSGTQMIPVLGDPSRAILVLRPYPTPRQLFHWVDEILNRNEVRPPYGD